MKFQNKEISLKFDNLAMFNLCVAGLSVGDLLVTEKSNAEKFCKAWSCVLDVKFDGDTRKFMNGFSTFNAVEINDIVISALERDGVIPKESPKKKAPKKTK